MKIFKKLKTFKTFLFLMSSFASLSTAPTLIYKYTHKIYHLVPFFTLTSFFTLAIVFGALSCLKKASRSAAVSLERTCGT